jgi:hypothetical protein
MSSARSFVSRVAVLGAALASGACAAPAVSPAPASSPTAIAVGSEAAPITAEAMRARIYFLAADALRGRDTPSPELETAAAYLASEAQRIGLEPAGENGGYYQRWPYSMYQLRADATQLGVTGPRGTETLRLGRDFFAVGAPGADVEGAMVFVGAELSPEAEAAGVLRDRIAVFVLPGTGDRNWRMARTRQFEAARQAGARAVIHVLDPAWGEPQIQQSAAQTARAGRVLGQAPPIAQYHLAHAAAGRLFAAADLSLDRLWQEAANGGSPGVTLAGLTARAAAPRDRLEQADPPNVVAVLPGRDPALRDEHIILSAHFDHVGVGTPMNGDSIYNGADDNASGTAALLEIARALLMLPESERPRRSVAFLWVSGEEKGLLGSRWFSDNPTIPIEQLVANINMDMISGDRHRDSVVVIGKDYSTMGETVNRVIAGLPELNLIASDDIWPEQQFFYRSDQLNFMRKEIPSLFFFTGVHECYHRPCDTVEFTDPSKAARVSNLVLHTVRALADADERPRWDPEGLEEVRRLTQ